MSRLFPMTHTHTHTVLVDPTVENEKDSVEKECQCWKKWTNNQKVDKESHMAEERRFFCLKKFLLQRNSTDEVAKGVKCV